MYNKSASLRARARKGGGECPVTYCCKNCGFLFGRLGQARQCPICESGAIQPASPEEEERFCAARERLLKGELYLTEKEP